MFATGDWVQIDLEAYGAWYRETYNAPMLFKVGQVFKVTNNDQENNLVQVRAYDSETRIYRFTSAWVPARFIRPL